MVAILGYSRRQIVAAVQGMYTTVADSPDSPFHFPVGSSACRLLGYPPEQVAELPEPLLESFAGVGYPFRAKAVQPGDRVLDIGAGAGNDSLIASRLVGSDGHVIALDLTAAMTRKLKHSVAEAGVSNVSVLQASAERLPLADASIDSITSNGALNLVPDKRRAVAEMFRVLRPQGLLQLADVVIHRPVSVDCHDDPRLWVECVVGATVKENLLILFQDAGFEDIRILNTHDYFAHSPSSQTQEIAASFGAHSVELVMQRGQQAPPPIRQWLRRLDPQRWLASIRRRGLFGIASLALALLACYGTLASVGLLASLGVGLAVDEALWASAIALFALLTVAAIGAGARRHHSYAPSLLAAVATAAVLYPLFVDYHALVELAGFVLLAAATGWDLYLRRRNEARVLGVDSTSNS